MLFYIDAFYRVGRAFKSVANSQDHPSHSRCVAKTAEEHAELDLTPFCSGDEKEDPLAPE